MNGVVSYWDERRWLGGIRAGSTSFLVLRQDIERDEIGRQFLIPHESITFDVSPIRNDRAVNVTPQFRKPITEQFPEDITLRAWDPRTKTGWGAREVGGDLYVDAHYITSEGIETLEVGSKLWVWAAPSDVEGKNWIASQAEIYIPKEQEDFF